MNGLVEADVRVVWGCGRFCRSLESALRHDVPLRVLGWGVPWEGHAQKVRSLGTKAHRLLYNPVVEKDR
jgi:hypothetical protein